jgi:hypothetical protein
VIAEAVVVVAERQEEGAVPHAADVVAAPAQEAEQRQLLYANLSAHVAAFILT